MSSYGIGIVGLVVFFILLLLHTPIGIAMGLVGMGGFAVLTDNLPAALTLLGTEAVIVFSSQTIVVVPLFLLMGGFASAAGLSGDAYRLAYAWIGERRGGLAMATVVGCAGFGAVCGSSVAGAATMTKVSLKEMEERGYATQLGIGSIASAGSLAALIPPSIVMVIYAYLTEQFVIDLFIAGIVPGLLSVVLYMATIRILVQVWPEMAPPGPRLTLGERLRVTLQSWRLVTVVGAVIGGIYSGLFTVTEAASFGVVLTLGFGLARGTITRKVFWNTLLDTSGNVGMIYLIIVGAHAFAYFVSVSQMPQGLVAWIQTLGLEPFQIILALVVMYIVLGCIFETVVAMVLTLPFVFPLVVSLGYDPIWWGIVNVIIIEVGLVTPPIGLNVFVVQGVRPDIPLQTIFRGVTPFLAADAVRLVLLISFPWLALWLPSTMS